MFAVLRGDRDTALANIPVIEIMVKCFLDTNDDDWLKSVLCCLTLARLFLQGLPECDEDGGPLLAPMPGKKLNFPVHPSMAGLKQEMLQNLRFMQSNPEAFKDDTWVGLLAEMAEKIDDF